MQTHPRFQRTTRHIDNEACLNCGTVFIGNFCPHCGQDAVTGAPTTLGFIYELATRYAFENGKLPRTLWRLLRYPGALTVDFLEGRRERYVRPVRLFLGLLAVYFLVLFCFPDLKKQEHDNDVKQMMRDYVSATQATTRNAASTPAAAPKASIGQKFQTSFDDDVALIARYWPSPKIKQKADAFLAQSVEVRVEQAAIEHGNAMRTVFILSVPILAMALKLLFFRQKISYGAHLLFSMNYFTFMFLLEVVTLATPIAFHFWFALIYIGYGGLALRNVYFCTWWSAIWRSLVLIGMFVFSLYYLSSMLGALGMLLQ